VGARGPPRASWRGGPRRSRPRGSPRCASTTASPVCTSVRAGRAGRAGGPTGPRRRARRPRGPRLRRRGGHRRRYPHRPGRRPGGALPPDLRGNVTKSVLVSRYALLFESHLRELCTMDYAIHIVVAKVAISSHEVIKRDTITSYDIQCPTSIGELGLCRTEQIALLEKVQNIVLAEQSL